MKRENYLKPQTVREQVALEQGICAASIFEPNSQQAVVESAAQGYREIGASEGFAGSGEGDGFEITWN
jgi:hypothetical protein